MNGADHDDRQLLRELIHYIDGLAGTCRDDLHELNVISRQLRSAKLAGRLSQIHYTVDQERLQRTLHKCKQIILTLMVQRKRAVTMLKELQT